MPVRIDKLTEEQKARFTEWADRWIEIGLRTGNADRAKFERAVRKCYEFSGLELPKAIVWIPSPIVGAIAFPVASLLIEIRNRIALGGAAVGEAVRGAVDMAVSEAVSVAVGAAVSEAVSEAVSAAVSAAVREAVSEAVGAAVGGAVRGAVGEAVGAAVSAAVGGAVGNVISRLYANYIGGQFWCGGWYWGGVYTSFFREVCNLDLEGNLWERGKTYEETIQSACWWYPHNDFVMVCERPTEIHRELVNPSISRGLGSHRLHNALGPAVGFRDGWGVWAWHGVRVPRYIIENPLSITVAQIDAETNVEVRRVMIERYGQARYIQDSGAVLVHELPENYHLKGLRGAKLYRKEIPGDEPIVLISVRNCTPDSDGSVKQYDLRVDPNAYAGAAAQNCLAAIASTWRQEDGSLAFKAPQDYQPMVET